ncbi:MULTISPECIES: cyclic nucleotide-binding domain-containing protein [Planktothrix]|uniref:Cyclic nucleotide-binding protein n=1 Tax=Planktothrix rubescens CCAP 1459/22 TaxID=329571 RepID=A0A6J7ZS05_PLARU|nr:MULTISPECIES: cyclic nucleotide-binding domain-containing protein [Planktothrix]CAC5345128.1 Cyclic nucleotide-binding protein [Planktothrix rubescens NIVA-CYA 18]CAD5963798.1 Rap guanine nucleotide exchange factor 1 [Planktothrix rubescens NIVA-CYA 18]
MLQPIETVKLFEKQPEQRYLANQVIFEEGQTGEVLYGILEGEIELWVNGKVVETLTAGDVFGEGALVQPDHTRASTAIAKTDCLLATMDKSRFLFAVQETPMFALEVVKSYSDRLRRLKHSI